MAPTLKSPFFELPPPVFKQEPFFSPLAEGWSNGSPLERSIRGVMAQYGAADVPGSALLPSYRCLRRRRPQEDNQAVAVTSDENQYKITMDVRDFADGSIKVRAVGDHELVVEGIQETKTEAEPNASTKTMSSSSRRFQQRFMFPGLQVEGVASTVSSDGVLTVTAPRKSTDKKAVEFQVPVTAASQDTQTSSVTQHTSVSSTTKGSEQTVPIQMKSEAEQYDNVASNTSQASSKQSVAESVKTEGVTQKSNNSNLTTTSKDIVVPIDNRGLFFKDSFFENSRKTFEQAVENVRKHIETDMSLSPDPFNWYSNLRCSDRAEDMRAGTITTEGNTYKVVLDVRDFEDGNITVKALGEGEIIVEGKTEKKSGGSSMSKSFRRRFVLPGLVKNEAITSARSSDGVLTITAPKKESHFMIKDVTNEMSSVTSPTSVTSGPFSPVFAQGDKKTEDSFANAQKTNTTSETKTESNVIYCSDKTNESSSTNVGEKKVAVQYVDKNQSEIDSDNSKFQLIGPVKDLTDANIKETVKQRKHSSHSSSNSKNDREISINLEGSDNFSFPIVRRGPFYQDSFFNEVHQNFQSAVRQVLDRWVNFPALMSSNMDAHSQNSFDRFNNTLSNYKSILDQDSFEDFACYKSLRDRSHKDENQVATFREDKENFKLVLDVHGYTEKDLTIRATSQNEIVVEGRVEDKAPGSSSTRSFRKQFFLPGRVRMEAVCSALSADDVLTITVPKSTALSITN